MIFVQIEMPKQSKKKKKTDGRFAEIVLVCQHERIYLEEKEPPLSADKIQSDKMLLYPEKLILVFYISRDKALKEQRRLMTDFLAQIFILKIRLT